MGGGFSGGAGGTPWRAEATGATWLTAGPAPTSTLTRRLWEVLGWLEFRDVVRTSLAVSCEGDTSSPQGTAPVTSPGTGTCCQCPLLTHSFPSRSATDTFPSGPGFSAAGVSQGLGAVLRPPSEEPGLGGSVWGSVPEPSRGPCLAPLAQDVHCPSIPVAVLPSFWDACFLGAVVLGELVWGCQCILAGGFCPQSGGCWGPAPCPWVLGRAAGLALAQERGEEVPPGDVRAVALRPWQRQGSRQCFSVLTSHGTVQLLGKLRHGGAGQDLLEWDCSHRGGASYGSLGVGQRESPLPLAPLW